MSTKKSLNLFVALALVAAANAQETKITAEYKAMTVDQVVGKLAEISGQRLGASGTVKSEIVYLNVKDQSVEAIKTRLADILGAEWRQEGTDYYLARTAIAEQKQRNAEIAARADRLRLELAKTIEANAKLAAFDAAEAQRLTAQFQSAIEAMRTGGGQNWRRMVELSNQLPAGRAIVSVVAQMNMMDLASIPAGARRVFAVSPTRMQGQLPNATMRLVSRMVQDQLLMEQTANEAFGEMAGMMLNGGRQGPAPAGDVTNVLLVVTRFGGGDTLSLTLVPSNQAGLALTSGNMTLGIPAETTPETRTKLLGEGKPVTLTPESKEMLAALRNGPRGGQVFVGGGGGGRGSMTVATALEISGATAPPSPANAKLTDSLRSKMMRPEQFDPLMFFVADAFGSLSKQHERNIIALLPDNAFAALATPLSQADPKTDAVVTALQNSDMLFADADGWLTVSPKSPTAARERVDRVAYSRLLAALQKSPVLTLDEMASYFATAPNTSGFGFMGFETGYATALNSGTSFQQMMQTFGRDRDALRFYGRLSTSQRMALKNGQSLQLAGLSAPQKEAVERLVFWSFDGPQRQQPLQQQPQGGRQERTQMIVRGGPGGGMMMGSQDPQNERTTILSNGMPSTGTISMASQQEQVIMARQADGKPTLLSIFALAANRAALAGAGGNMPGGFRMEGTQYDGYQVAGQTNYNLSFTLMPGYVLSRSLEDPNVDPNGKYVAYDQLPVPIRNAVTQAMQRMQQGGGMFGGGPGGGGPGGGRQPRP